MKRGLLIHEELTGSAIGAFYEVYNTLGFGFREHAYSRALERELLAYGHQVGREVSVIVYYKGEALCRQRVDMVVDEKLVIEIKSTFDLRHGVRDQLYNYLRATNLDVGLLLHFGQDQSSTASSRRPSRYHPPNPNDPVHPITSSR